MTLHLIKLCVGVESLEELRAGLAAQGDQPCRHVTRMSPKRLDDLLDGGSLYWVIRGFVAARQKLRAIEPFVDADGIRRCALVLDPELVEVEAQPRAAFQGWRYLDPAAAPRDRGAAQYGGSPLPEALRHELRALGLL